MRVMDLIHIGDTVDVASAPGEWHGEVITIAEDGTARVRCIRPPASVTDRDPFGLRPGDDVVINESLLIRSGDPDGMRADGCDDVDVTGHVRPMHRHAVTGKAHAHPGGGLAHTHQVGPHAAGLVQALPAGDHSLRDALAEPVATVEDGGLLPYELRRMADPVEAVAWVVRAHKFRDRNVTRSGAPDDADRADAQEMLAALVAGPWRLIVGTEGLDGLGVEIDQEWRP